MRRIIFIHGDKGGVGKSMFARALLDHYCRSNTAVAAYDSDKRNADLARTYGGLAPVQLIDLSSATAFDAVLDQLSAEQSSRALIDLAAGAGDEDGAQTFTNRRRIRAFVAQFDEELAKAAELL